MCFFVLFYRCPYLVFPNVLVQFCVILRGMCIIIIIILTYVFRKIILARVCTPQKNDLKCANQPHSSEEISLPLPAPLFILLNAFQNDCWSRRFFVKPSHMFSSYSLCFFLLDQTMVFCPLCYISNPIATTLGSFHRLNNRFTLCIGLPTFIVEQWNRLLFPFRLKHVFFIGSAFSKRDTTMSSVLFGLRASSSVASPRVFVNTLDLTLFWNVHVRLSCQTSFVTTVAWSAFARVPCFTGMCCDSTREETWTCTIFDSGKVKGNKKIVIHVGPTV